MTSKKQIKVLIVDDIPADARLFQLMLEDVSTIGEVIIEPDYHRVQEHLSAHVPEVILFDIGAYSTEKIEALRHLPTEVDSYIIATAGIDLQDSVLEIYQAGAQDLLTKGQFTGEELAIKIQIGLLKLNQTHQLNWVKKMGLLDSWQYQISTKKLTFPNISNFIRQEDKHLFQEKMMKTIESYLSEKTNLSFSLPKKEKHFILSIDPDSAKSTALLKGIIQDVSERKKSERLLNETHQKYIDIFANSSDGIYLSSTMGRGQECNKSGLEIFGLSDKEFLQTNLHQLFDGEKAKEVLIEIGYKESIKNREIEIIRADGTRRNCLISVVYFSDQTDFYTGIIRDITERKIAEKIKITRALEIESNQLKEQFIAGISHEMRTPMNAIVGLSNLLLDTNLNEEQRGYLKSIHYSSEQLLGILNDILDISSLQNGKIIFENKNFDIHDMLNNLVHNLSYEVNNKNVSLELAIDPNIPHILKGDKLRINQILFNLAGNAIKFTEDGSVKISCSLLGRSGDSILIKFAIADTGIGIPLNKQEAIFESFTRIKHKAKTFEGTGLGLAISKNLIEQQGGKIWVKSTPEVGSTFFFDMVLEVGEKQQPENKKQIFNAITIVNPKRILLVEDNKMNQLVARKLLAKRWPEMEILLANNGQEAMDIISPDIDIVLMDLHMPVMDGYEATLGIRAHTNPEISSLPILAMTADAQIQVGDKFRTHKLDGFIVKPFDPGLLYEKILLHLNKTKV